MFWQDNLSLDHLISGQLPIPYDLKSLSCFELWNISKNYTIFILFPPFCRGMPKDKGISFASWGRGCWIFYNSFSELIIKIFLRKVHSPIAFCIDKWNIDIKIRDDKPVGRREDIIVKVLGVSLSKLFHSECKNTSSSIFLLDLSKSFFNLFEIGFFLVFCSIMHKGF